KNKEGIDLDRILVLADERKVAAGAIGDLNKKRNDMAKASQGGSPGSSPSDELKEAGKNPKEGPAQAEEKFKEIEKGLVGLLVKVPNIPSADTPVGPDESGNVVVRQWGEKPQFTFTPKAHWDIGKSLGIIESEKAGDISGARFTYLKGDLALMQFALIQ